MLANELIPHPVLQFSLMPKKLPADSCTTPIPLNSLYQHKCGCLLQSSTSYLLNRLLFYNFHLLRPVLHHLSLQNKVVNLPPASSVQKTSRPTKTRKTKHFFLKTSSQQRVSTRV